MTLVTGTKLGRYEIRSQLGAGGMGEVYLARDPKINRDVAIKVLPAAFSSDSERLGRFEQEVQATGKLNHPNILAVHDVETHDGAPYVVYELLEGETLRESVSGGALAARKAVDYALQIAHGLAAAHEKRIIHRDLKPENIFITHDGRVKILDFGLAKLTEPLQNAEAQTDVLTRRVKTDPGAVMGTVGYMSPEQVRGKSVDHRSDIFSLGAVLYEMLSGKRAFHGESVIETLNAILKEDPPELSESNSQINSALEKVVMHCLEKRPEQRFQSAGDVAFALDSLSGVSSSRTVSTALPLAAERPRNRERLAWIGMGVCLLGLLASLPFTVSYFRRAPVDERVFKLSVLPPEKATLFQTVAPISLSPDGRRLAIVAAVEGQNLLWVRALDSTETKALSGTEGATNPFWSPDSRFIGFFAGGKLKKIDASGGPPQSLSDVAAETRGATWNRDGVIVFSPGDFFEPLYRISAAGGEPTPVTVIDQSRFETSHRWPHFLPDGRHFLYWVRSSSQAESGGIFVGSLDSKETKRLLPTNLNAAYAPPGFLLFLRNETLMAQRFDADELQLAGEPFPVAEHVAFNLGLGRGAFSVSENGVLAYRTGSGVSFQLLWFDRGGKQIGSVGAVGQYFTLWLSPDERRVAVDRNDPQTGTNDIWLFDLLRGIPSRFTSDPASDSNPLWSPDGSRIVFTSSREGGLNLYQKITSGVGNEEVLLKSSKVKTADDWSSDGQFIVYQTLDPKTKWDLWVLPLSGDRQPFPFAETEFNELQAQFSPDGKWIVYTSDESGAWEVYIQTFPASSGKWRVSTSGGCQPKWRRDGKELFYIAADRKLMAVDVKLGETFEAGVPKTLFLTRVITLTSFRNHYAVTADGQRFLINSRPEESATPISIVVNWTADLKR
jgi:serine/threonine protein kinase/Tol biopolymer transport system component